MNLRIFINTSLTQKKNITTSSNLSSPHKEAFAALTTAQNNTILAWIIVTSLISFVGAFFNILVLLVTRPTRRRKSSFGLLIFHFVIVNLYVCLITIPTGVFAVLARRNGSPLSANFCLYYYPFHLTGISVVNWSDAVLATNRCTALFLPHKYRFWAKTSNNCVIIVAIWSCSALSALLVAASPNAGKIVMLPFGQCATIPAPTALGGFATAIGSFVPYTIAGFGTFLILWKSWQLSSSRSTYPESIGTGRTSSPLAHRLTMSKMLLFTFLWSAMCSMPTYFAMFLYPKGVAGGLPSWTVPALWVRAAAPCQYGITPCVLLLSNMQYRSRLMRIVRNQPPSHPGISDTAHMPVNVTTAM